MHDDNASQPPLNPPRVSADPRFDVANRLFFRLYQASNLMHRTGTRAVSGHGATTQQWAVMGALSRHGVADTGMSVKELMALLAVSRQSLTMVLNRRIRLTQSGHSTWTLMLVDIRRYYDAAIKDFSTADAEQLFRLLQQLTIKLVRL
jgi:MarR family transcriptional regulator, organic hydroperoxide resistance regulator